MDSFVIEGGARLRGTLRIAGSKNAALPVMAAALLADGKSVIADIPNLQDIRSQIELLKLLGGYCFTAPPAVRRYPLGSLG